MMPVTGRGRLCPVCLKPARDGACGEHGPWQPHQLATTDDRRAASRQSWQPFEPLLHACPRCLGDVAEARAGFECVDHPEGRDPHGPFQVDELLGATSQREAAAGRTRLARRELAKHRPRPARPARPALQLPDPARLWRLIGAATVLAATVAFLSR
jgi:hypothetical protein